MNAIRPPTKPRPPLGPKQLAWCRAPLAHFARCQDQATAAKAESEAARKAMEEK